MQREGLRGDFAEAAFGRRIPKGGLRRKAQPGNAVEKISREAAHCHAATIYRSRAEKGHSAF